MRKQVGFVGSYGSTYSSVPGAFWDTDTNDLYENDTRLGRLPENIVGFLKQAAAEAERVANLSRGFHHEPCLLRATISGPGTSPTPPHRYRLTLGLGSSAVGIPSTSTVLPESPITMKSYFFDLLPSI